MDAPNFCQQCGCQLASDAQFCHECGAKNIENLEGAQVLQPSVEPPKNQSTKSPIKVLLWAFILGLFGGHRFYVGKIGTGLLMLVTLGGFGFWYLIDLIFLVMNKFEDKKGRLVVLTENPSSFKKAWMVSGTIIIWFVLLFSTIFALAVYITSALDKPIDKQLEALKKGDIKAAYAYTSKDFQNATSLDDFKAFIKQYPSLTNNRSSFFNERQIENNVGVMKGTLTAKDGAKTPIQYRLIKEDGVWKILNIEVLPTGAGVDIKAHDEISAANNNAVLKVFEAKGSRYSISYPADWTVEEPEKSVVLFRGKAGTAAQYASVNIQTVLATKTGGKYDSSRALMDALKAQLYEIDLNTKILAQGKAELPQDPKGSRGEYMVFTYKIHNKVVKQLQFVIFRADEMALYTWAYMAPADRYEANLQTAKAMYESWSIR